MTSGYDDRVEAEELRFVDDDVLPESQEGAANGGDAGGKGKGVHFGLNHTDAQSSSSPLVGSNRQQTST
jgi:hypothetical protein